MKKRLSGKLALFLFSLSLHTSSFAFSSSPENKANYSPANWVNSQSAENDANIAIENNDLRLLGFAGRTSSIPGIRLGETQDHINKCGIRYFEEFGDVIKSNDQLRLMKQARDYAIKYNTVVLETCSVENQ